MQSKILNRKEEDAIKVLIFFYLRIGRTQAAKRGADALIALNPRDPWPRGIKALCANEEEAFEEVIKLTDDLALFADDEKQKRSMLFLRMRAFNKLGNRDQVKHILDILQIKVDE